MSKVKLRNSNIERSNCFAIKNWSANIWRSTNSKWILSRAETTSRTTYLQTIQENWFAIDMLAHTHAHTPAYAHAHTRGELHFHQTWFGQTEHKIEMKWNGKKVKFIYIWLHWVIFSFVVFISLCVLVYLPPTICNDGQKPTWILKCLHLTLFSYRKICIHCEELLSHVPFRCFSPSSSFLLFELNKKHALTHKAKERETISS